ncbi:MAG: transcription antitermination factor NusB [Nitrospirae bacterium]|nr:transcription antitermination factor NusB [Nitrospirota bacterium]
METLDVSPPNEAALAGALDNFWSEAGESDPKIRAFTEEIVKGTILNSKKIDSIIQKVAEKWTLSRMAAIDRNILRAATYELLFRRDIPSAVTINEALEIAKKYSTADSASFINGILDKVAKKYSAKDEG